MQSNYPNMSYCMFQNTVGAMNQILEAIDEAKMGDGVLDFFDGMGRAERRSLQHLYDQCQQFMSEIDNLSEQLDARQMEDQ